MFSFVLILYFTIVFYYLFSFELPQIFCRSKIEINKNNNSLWLYKISLLTAFWIHFFSPFLSTSGKDWMFQLNSFPVEVQDVLWSSMATSLLKPADMISALGIWLGGHCLTTKRAKCKLLWPLEWGSLCQSLRSWGKSFFLVFRDRCSSS